MLPLILALKAFAAGVKDQTNTLCVRDVESSLLCLLRSESNQPHPLVREIWSRPHSIAM